jgi:hypothetical protein
MKFEKGKSEIPTGRARILEENKTKVASLEVKNEVVWVNPSLDLPFSLEVGKRTNLGIFASVPAGIFSLNTLLGRWSKKLETDPDHNRSALLGRVVIGERRNKEGEQQIYRDIDIKGLGLIDKYKGTVDKSGPHAKDLSETWGLLNLGPALHDAGMAELFHEYGIRTHRAIAVIKLHEIVQGERRISIAKAKKEGLIAEKGDPALEIRAFGTQARFIDVTSGFVSKERRDMLIEDARVLVAQELGLDEKNFTKLEYAKWLGRTLGKNFGLLRKHGYIHGYVREGHNITLDGCLVDFDSVKHVDLSLAQDEDEGAILKRKFTADYENGLSALLYFLIGIGFENEGEIEAILKEYKNAYKQNK